jgi:MYXO-CTERM domain-containing protein
MSCVGDSGGPVLVRDGAREVLAGLTVSGDVACRTEAVNVRVDALREDFLQPFLAEVPRPPEHVLAPEALCREACASDAECPSGLACDSSQEGAPGRCLLPALQEGAYGTACTDDASCGPGGLCARLEPEGDGACRCFTPCDTPPAASGCASVPGPALLGLLALAGALRRRAPRVTR